MKKQTCIIVVLNIVFIVWAMSSSHGKFDMILHGMGPCKGPRRKDCGRIDYKMYPGGRMIDVIVDVFQDELIDVIHIWAHKTLSAKHSEAITDIKLDNPCQQSLLTGYFHDVWTADAAGKGCLVKKGKYNYSVDVWSLTQKLWSGSFFYGNFTFKFLFYGPKCNLCCMKMNVTYSPKQ